MEYLSDNGKECSQIWNNYSVKNLIICKKKYDSCQSTGEEKLGGKIDFQTV